MHVFIIHYNSTRESISIHIKNFKMFKLYKSLHSNQIMMQSIFRFTRFVQVVSVQEDVPVDSVLTTVAATDADSDFLNKQIEFRIKSGGDGKISIDSSKVGAKVTFQNHQPTVGLLIYFHRFYFLP